MQGEDKAIEYKATDARNHFSDIFDAAYFEERVVVKKRDRRVAVVSMELIERLDALLELEARLDACDAKQALNEFHEKGGKTMEQLTQ